MKYLKKLVLTVLFCSQSIVYCADQMNTSQVLLLEKIADYIHSEATTSDSAEEKQNRLEVEKLFRDHGEFGGGVCFGLVYTWLYCQRMSDEPRTNPTKERDDMQFFNSVFHLLLDYKPTTKFTTAEKWEIERFISYIINFQKMSLLGLKGFEKQFDSFDFMSDTHDRKIQVKVDSFRALSEEVFIAKVAKILKPHVLLSISFYGKKLTKDIHGGLNEVEGGHIIGCYQSDHKDPQGNSFYVYDPNEENFIQSFENAEALGQYLWGRIDPTWIDAGRTSTLRQHVREFQFIIGVLSDGPVKIINSFSVLQQTLETIDSALKIASLIPDRLNDSRIKNLYILEPGLEQFYKKLYVKVPQNTDALQKIVQYVCTLGFPYSRPFKKSLIEQNPKLVRALVSGYVGLMTDLLDDVDFYMNYFEESSQLRTMDDIKKIQKILLDNIAKGQQMSLSDIESIERKITVFLDQVAKLDPFDSEFLEDEYREVLEILKDMKAKKQTPNGRYLKSIDAYISSLRLHYQTIERLVTYAIFKRIDLVASAFSKLIKQNTFEKDSIEKIIESTKTCIADLKTLIARKKSVGGSSNQLRDACPDEILKDFKDILVELNYIACFTEFGSIKLLKTPPSIKPKPTFLKKSVAEYQAALEQWINDIQNNPTLSVFRSFESIKSELYWLINGRVVTLPKIRRALVEVQKSINNLQGSKSKNALLLNDEYKKLVLLLQDLEKKLKLDPQQAPAVLPKRS